MKQIKFFLTKSPILIKKNFFSNRARLIFDRAIGASPTVDYRSAKNILLKFDNFNEAIENLFMKLLALNLTKFNDLDVKLKKIEPQIRIL